MINKKRLGHGFLPNKIEDTDYIFGGFKVPQDILQEDGQWDDYLPDIELQARNGLETMNCVVYGTLNCIETLYKRLYGATINKSERYIGVVAETGYWGNSPQKVIETIRKEAGLINEELLPFDDTINDWDEYYTPKPMSSDLLWVGQGWLKEHEIKHEWVFRPWGLDKNSKIKEALKYSPVGISVFIDESGEAIYTKPPEYQDNHWVMLYGYKEGKYWKIFDHYDNVFKKLAWNYEFEYAKRYYLKKKPPEINKSIWRRIIEFLKNLFNG